MACTSHERNISKSKVSIDTQDFLFTVSPYNYRDFLSGIFNEIGFQYFSIVFSAPDHINEEEAYADYSFLFSNYPEELESYYNEFRMVDYDTGLRHVLNSNQLGYWDALDEQHLQARIGDLKVELPNKFRDNRAKIFNGVTFPFKRTPSGLLAIFSLVPEDRFQTEYLVDKHRALLQDLFGLIIDTCPIGYLSAEYFKLSDDDLYVLQDRINRHTIEEIREKRKKRGFNATLKSTETKLRDAKQKLFRTESREAKAPRDFASFKTRMELFYLMNEELPKILKSKP